MRCLDMGEPCANFNILAVTRLRDPRDGLDKVVLSSYVAEGTGCLLLLEPRTGDAEQLVLPGDSGAWALLALDSQLLVGTCATFGYLHVLNLTEREWKRPLRVENETYIWQLCLGSDDMVYGGTWPGCALLRYDPRKHELVHLGKASDVAGNYYSRYVYGEIPGKILIECGWEQKHLSLYDIATGDLKRFGMTGDGVDYINHNILVTRNGDIRRYYQLPELTSAPGVPDLAALKAPPLPYASEFSHAVQLQDGTRLAVRGQSYYLVRAGDPKPALKPIPTNKPATAILGLCAAPDGTIWGSSAFGQTIFAYDPASGNTWNSEAVCDRGGEVYGMAWIDGRLFMSSYSGGDHIIYDPHLPWDQVHNQNPRSLQPAGPQLVRPGGRSLIGPDGAFYTGWWAAYGVYGGGITRVDPVSGQVTAWYDIIAGESVVGLACDDSLFYLLTTRRANGLPEHAEAGHLAVWSPRNGTIASLEISGYVPDWGIAAIPGGACVVLGDALFRYNLADNTLRRAAALPERFSYLLRCTESLLVFGQNTAFDFDPVTNQLSPAVTLPGPARAAVQAPDGTVYLASGSHLYRLG